MKTKVGLLSILILILIQAHNAEIDTSNITLADEFENSCDNYCFGIVNYLLDEKNAALLNANEFAEMKGKIHEQEIVIKGIETLNKLIKSKDSQLDQQVELSSSYKTQIQMKDVIINETKVEILNLKSLIMENDHKCEYADMLKEPEKKQLTELQGKTEEQKLIIDSLNETIKSKDIQLAEQLEMIRSYESQIKMKDVIINEKDVEILKLRTLDENNQKSASLALTDMRRAQEEVIQKLKITIDNKEIQRTADRNDYESRIRSLEFETIQKNEEIKNLQSQQKEYESNVSKTQYLVSRLAECRNMCLTSSCVGKLTDVSTIKVPGMDPFLVPCDSELADSGWTVIQRRKDGSEDFNRNWAEYKEGFGDLRGEFFLGLEKLHLLTNSQPHELYIHIEDSQNRIRYATYTHFLIGNETESYELKMLGSFSGTTNIALQSHLNYKFATPDRDNENGCAMYYKSGWWFRNCGYCNLNGNLSWLAWNIGQTEPIKFTQMMIRPRV